ncbi:MAG: hypothetical protein AAFV86_03090 [Pseudomonadota bacterium]
MPKPKIPSSGFTQTRFNAEMVTRHYVNKHGQYTGLYSKNVRLRGKRSYHAERQTQFNTHFATVLKEWYSSLDSCSEIEVQIAYVNGRYFIAANNDATMRQVYDTLVLQAGTKTLVSQVRHMAKKAHEAARRSTAGDAYRRRRHALKMRDALDEKRTHIGIGTFKQHSAAITLSLDATQQIGTQVKAFIDGTSGHSLCLVTSGKVRMHAEQKIMLALCQAYGAAGSNDLVTFAGTFRPCRGCFESLSLMQTYLLPKMVFCQRPGHYWRSTSRGHSMIFDILWKNGRIPASDLPTKFGTGKLLKGLTTDTYRPLQRNKRGGKEAAALHYASDSDSEDDGPF